MSKSPVVIIGIDGADPRLLKNWVEKGYLPNIAEIVADGSGICRLASSPNAMSPSAWTSFRTGLTPGRHGIFYFLDKVDGKYEIQHSTKKIPSLQSFWKYAGEQGKKVAVLHVPLSYPAEDINGIQVTCWLTPSLQSKGFTHPPSLARKIMDNVPEFRIHWPFKELIQRNKYHEALEFKLRSIHAKNKLARFLLNNKKWDLVIIVFEEIDQLQHFFWHFMDERHPRHIKSADKQLKEAILSGYIAIDKAIGDIKKIFGNNGRYIIISDHGFRANTYGPLFVSDLLKKAGYQSQKKSFLSKISKYSYGIAELMPTKFKHLLNSLIPKIREGVLEKSCFDDVDWEETKAYTIYLNRTSEIWINLKGRDPCGRVLSDDYHALCAELTDLLLTCRELKSGEHPIRKVLKKEDIYQGKYINFAPDLTLKWAEDIFVNGLIHKKGKIEIVADDPIEKDIRTGDHSDYGVFIDNSIGNLEDGSREIGIVDIPPHILNLLGLEVPKWMEGDPSKIQGEEIEKEKFFVYPETENGYSYSIDDKKQIEKILRDIGYL